MHSSLIGIQTMNLLPNRCLSVVLSTIYTAARLVFVWTDRIAMHMVHLAFPALRIIDSHLRVPFLLPWVDSHLDTTK